MNKIMVLVILLLLLIPSTGHTEGNATDQLIKISSTLIAEDSVDTSTIKIFQDDKDRIIVVAKWKKVFSKIGIENILEDGKRYGHSTKDFSELSYLIADIQMMYGSPKQRVLRETYYSSKGKEIRSKDYGSDPPWQKVIPSTYGEVGQVKIIEYVQAHFEELAQKSWRR